MAEQSQPLLAFFTRMENQGGVIVRETPKLDIESYISNYKGRTRFERLLLIGQCSVPLSVDALKAAIAEAKAGRDVQRYREAWEHIHIAAPNEPEAHFDQEWTDRITTANKQDTQRLEQELRHYKNNLVKESVRIGQRDLGEHFEQIGELAAATEAYVKMRADASHTSHVLDVSKHLASIMLQKHDWPSVLANVNKMLASNLSEEDIKDLQPYQKMVSGIAYLHSEKYYEAARNFLETGEPGRCQQYNDVASRNDVATYGGLLALASMDRSELHSRVLENSNFRNYLELEPHLRKAISMFVNGRYSQCLAILESYRADYLLDIHLQRQVPAIYSQIRNKCIVQYFRPFSCVTLTSMNEAFAKPGESLEAELVTMIKSGVLQARINTIDKLLVAVSTDRRTEMQVKGLEAAKNYEKEALERIRRMSLAAADLEVKGKRPLPGLTDPWVEESRRQVQAIQGGAPA